MKRCSRLRAERRRVGAVSTTRVSIQQLAQAGQPGPVGAPRRRRDRARRQCGVELIDHLGGEVGDQPAVPGQHHRQALTEHRLDPGTGPAQPVSRLPHRREPGRIPGLDRGGEPGQLLDGGQLDIQPDPACADRVAHQRPRPARPQFSGPLDRGQSHPRSQIRVAGQEFARDTGPVPHRSLTQP